jgi:hypothetical protein
MQPLSGISSTLDITSDYPEGYGGPGFAAP